MAARARFRRLPLMLLVGLGLLGGLGVWVVLPDLVPGREAPALARTPVQPRRDGPAPGQLRPPAGFTVSRYAEGLPMARILRFTGRGDLLVSRPRAGEVVLLEADRDRDGRPDGRRVLLSGLAEPHGIDLAGGRLYVAVADGVVRVPLDEERGEVRGRPERIVSGLPRGGGHWTRSVRVSPDGKMYVSIGSSCNVCIEKDPRRAAVVRYDLDGKNERLFATGLRNSVGLAFQPGTGRLYATDNGRDLLGDDFPPCELNLLEEGGFYGWPFANGDRVPDPDLGKGREREIAASRPPVHGFPAHNAPLGITFLEGARLPQGWDGKKVALVALHGSWNRSRKSGYKVVSLHFTDRGVRQEDFLAGFLRDEDQSVSGRPVDVAVGPDGALYVSDDLGGAVYRVSYGGP